MSLPSRADQIHSFHPTIAPNGLYWTVAIPSDALRLTADGRQAEFEVRDLAVIDQPTAPLPGPTYPAVVSARARWRGSGDLLGFTDPANRFRLQFYRAEAWVEFTAEAPDLGFRFTSAPLPTSESLFAMLGSERNGAFF